MATNVLSSVLAFRCHFWWHLLHSLIITIFASTILTIKLTFLSPCQATVFQYNTALCTMLNSIWWIFQYDTVGVHKRWMTIDQVGCFSLTLYVCVRYTQLCTTLDNIPTSYKAIWQRLDDKVLALAWLASSSLSSSS